MRIASRSCLLLGLLVTLLALGLDQLSKWYLVDVMDMPNQPPMYITSFFDVVMVWNRGISFGIMAAQNQPIFLMIMAVVIVAMLIAWLCRTSSRLVAAALGCVVGGAAGNIIDRLRFGAVADFLDFHVGIYHWPAFNIADSLIFIGVVLLCLDGMFKLKNNT